MKDKGYKLGLRGKATLVLTGVIFLALAITSLISYEQSKTVAERKVIELEESKFTLFKHEIEGALDNHHRNLMTLHDVPPIQAILRALAHDNIDPESEDSLQTWRQRLIIIFTAFLDNHPEYLQIRYIGAGGDELVRVQTNTDGNVSNVPEAELQNKSDSLYVRETLKRQVGEAYYSDVTLNHERGMIQESHVPVLRLAVPVHNRDKQSAGLIVIDLSTEKLFGGFSSESNGVQRNIVDEKGYYIKHADASKVFGLERGLDYRFQDVEPELAEIATRQDQFMRRDTDDKELNGFQKIYISPLDRSRYWLLTLHVPEHVVFADVATALNKMLFISLLIGLLSLIFILWFISKKILMPVVIMAAACRRLKDGDLTVRVDEASAKDEFFTLYTGINAFAAYQEDATEQLKNEVESQTKRLSAVIDNVVDGIITIGERGIIESFNSAARKIFGYSNDEVIGQNVKMLMPEPYHSEHDGYLDHHIRTGEKKVIGIGREVTGQRKDGTTFPMELAVSEVIIDTARHFVGITRDITERKVFEQQIVDEKKQLAAVIDNVVDGIITIGERGRIESFNPAARRIFGYSNDEVIGQNVKVLMPEPYHSEHDGYLDHHIRTGEKKVIGIGREVTGQRKDGTTFPMELAVSEVIIDNVRHFVGITRDITERKHTEQMQKEFISTVSHELRTPLTSIRGSLGLILGGVTGELPAKTHALLTIANNNSERLIHLINDILDIEKISAGKMEFDYCVMDLIPVIQQAVESNKGYGDELQVNFKLHVGSDAEVMVNIDEKRIAQVMSNLLSNAAKYSPGHDQVDISIEVTEERVRISVHDHGKGIPEAFKAKIFSKFSQADSSDTRQKGGTGLGLSITKAIVMEHGGNIDFESHEGKGTTFYVDLPLWHEALGFEQSVDRDDVDGHEATNKPLLLVVEDDVDVSKLLCMMLEKEGYCFDQAFNYQEAMQKIQTHQYSAMTLDLMIPGGSGLTLLRELRNYEATKDLPVIVVSAKANEGRLEVEGDAFSMVDWIEKPIDENRLLTSIRSGIRHTALQNGRVLHVEDDPDIATFVDSLLSDECQVVHARTLAKAIQFVTNEAFDLVLLDIGLPDGSGLDLLPMLSLSKRHVPVIIFSAQDVSADVARQVKGVLIKSKTDNEKLMQQIKLAINKRKILF